MHTHADKNTKPENRSAAHAVTQKKNQAAPHSHSQAHASKPNLTGLPDDLKTGVEDLSGYSMDDVKVHYNSSQPAQLNAHAYAQGSDIHIGPGQEKHLPHEAWHVVQQKQGRVKPTKQMKGKVNVNDDEGLEREADQMGAKAIQRSAISSSHSEMRPHTPHTSDASVVQRELNIAGETITHEMITNEGALGKRLDIIIGGVAELDHGLIKKELLQMVDEDFAFDTLQAAVDHAVERIKLRAARETIPSKVAAALDITPENLSKESILAGLKKEFQDYPGGFVAATREPVLAEVLLEQVRLKQSGKWQKVSEIQEVDQSEWKNDELQHWSVRHYTTKIQVTLGEDLGQGYFKVANIAPPPFDELLSTLTLSAMSGSSESEEEQAPPTHRSGATLMMANTAGAASSGHTTGLDWANVGNVGDTFYALFYKNENVTGKVPSFIKNGTYYARWSLDEFGEGWASEDWLGKAKKSRDEKAKTLTQPSRKGHIKDIIADMFPEAATRDLKGKEEPASDKKRRESKFSIMHNFEVKKHGPMPVKEWIPLEGTITKLKGYIVNANKGTFVKLFALLPLDVKKKLKD